MEQELDLSNICNTQNKVSKWEGIDQKASSCFSDKKVWRCQRGNQKRSIEEGRQCNGKKKKDRKNK
jgi:hypothetical protein